jgi:colicin import membrane protein
MSKRFFDSSDDLDRLCRTSVIDSIDSGAGGGGGASGSGAGVSDATGEDDVDVEGLKRKHAELLSETKKSKAAARDAAAREERVMKEAEDLKARLEKLEKEKLTDQERQVRTAEEAVAKSRRLEVELEAERLERARDRAVSDAIRAGVLGEDVQEFVASKLLVAKNKDPSLDKDGFFAELRAKSPAFFAKSETKNEQEESGDESKAVVPPKGTAGGHESPRGSPSRAQLQVAYDKALAAYKVNPRDSLVVYKYVEAKKALER